MLIVPRHVWFAIAVLPVWASAGCQHLVLRDPGYAAEEGAAAEANVVPPQREAAAEPAASTTLAEEASPANTETPTSVTLEDPPAVRQQSELAEILAELEEVGETDPELQRELMASVRQMAEQAEEDPLLWPRVRGTIMAAISYRRQQQRPTDTLRQQAPVDNTDASPRPAETPVAAPLPGSELSGSPLPHSARPAAVDLHQPDSLAPPPVPTQTAAPVDVAKLLDNTQATPADNMAVRLAALRHGRWGFGQSTDAVSIDGQVSPVAAPRSPDWQSHLQQAITTLETQTQGAPQTAEEINRHAALRMLYLLAGKRDQAVAPITGISPELQDFWSNQLYGLAMVQDTTTITDPARRATEAATHLRYANQRLGEAGTLEIRNLAFCKSAQGFGLYEPFSPRTFQAGQQVVLYLEIDNFRTSPGDQGHALALAGNYRIVDQRGKMLFTGELGEYKEQCRSLRRDLYYSSLIQLPGALPAGDYTMQVSVEDKIGRKTADASISFTITGR